ncbi:MAG TPA: hypothetical protein PLJ44_08870, partial [Victivallales bacterium]|nr:hypothetical protein [Victivallales bacterium]
MNNWFILIFTIISIMNFLLLASSRISGCINILALQGGIISLISILNATNLWGILTFVFIFSIKA